MNGGGGGLGGDLGRDQVCKYYFGPPEGHRMLPSLLAEEYVIALAAAGG